MKCIFKRKVFLISILNMNGCLLSEYYALYQSTRITGMWNMQTLTLGIRHLEWNFQWIEKNKFIDLKWIQNNENVIKYEKNVAY